MSRFDYVKFDMPATKCMLHYKALFVDLEERLDLAIPCAVTDREIKYWEAAMHYAELSYAMIGKAIRDAHITNNKETKIQEERGNE